MMHSLVGILRVLYLILNAFGKVKSQQYDLHGSDSFTWQAVKQSQIYFTLKINFCKAATLGVIVIVTFHASVSRTLM